MGFHTRQLPELEYLKDKHSTMSDEEFLHYYLAKADALVGPSESIQYIEEVQKKISVVEKADK